MHTEYQIRKAIKPLLELYGKLTTTEVKEHLNEVLEFDEEDKQLSETRNEFLILQRIGNIVSHQPTPVYNYSEGFIVDKTIKPAKFIASRGLSNNEKPITEIEIKERKEKATKKKASYKKIDWELENERKNRIGILGEEFVFEQEQDFVKSFDNKSLEKVIHLSQMQGDGFGYDILSINENGETVFIEVKTTTGNKDTPFYMSRNEKSFFEDYIDENAFVYRVYNFNEQNRHGAILKISARELLNDYNFDPVSFMVTHKND